MRDRLEDGRLLRLLQRLDAKIEAGRSIQLSPEDLDILLACGAYGRLADAAREQREAAAKERLAARRAEGADASPTIANGQTRGVCNERAEEAAARVARTLNLKRKKPK